MPFKPHHLVVYLSMLISGSVFAEVGDCTRFYVGAAAQYNVARSYDSFQGVQFLDNTLFQERMGSFALKAGLYFNRLVTEFGYAIYSDQSYTSTFSKDGTTLASSMIQDTKNFYLDEYFIFNPAEKYHLSLVAGVGVIRSVTNAQFTFNPLAAGTTKVRDAKVKPRIGFNYSHHYTKSFFTNVKYVFQYGNETYKHLHIAEIGINYMPSLP